MKKILLSIAILSGILIRANAQKGSILVYGAAAYSTQSEDGSNTNKSLALIPGIGYQFTDHWTAGASLAYGYVNDGGGANVEHEVAVGPFLRYTKVLSDLFSIYGQLDVDYQRDSFNGSPGAETGVYGTLSPSVYLNIRNGFGLNFNFGGFTYNTLKLDDAGSSSTMKTFSVSFGQNLSIGLSKNFGGRNK